MSCGIGFELYKVCYDMFFIFIQRYREGETDENEELREGEREIEEREKERER